MQPVLYYGGQVSKAAAEDGWGEIFRFPSGTFPVDAKESFVGFSGWTGSTNVFEADLNWVEMTNFDMETIGEAEQDTFGDASLQWLQVIEKERQMIDQAGQSEAINRLRNMLVTFTTNYNTGGEKLREDFLHMETRLDALGADIATFLAAAQAYKLESQDFDAVGVKNHIVGIRSALSNSNKEHDQKLDVVHEAAKTLKATKDQETKAGQSGRVKVQSVAIQATAMEKLAARGSTQTNGFLLVIVIAMAGLGLLFLNRMRYYEKKHYI